MDIVVTFPGNKKVDAEYKGFTIHTDQPAHAGGAGVVIEVVDAVGAAADASLGLGAGAKVLVGGNNKSIVLQPLSVQAQTGINLAVGVSGLELVPR